MAPSALFIGNGLSRCLGGIPSWDVLLDKLRKELGMVPGVEWPTIEFERIMNVKMKQSKQGVQCFSEMKNGLAKNLAALQLPDRSIYDCFVSLPVSAFLTPNYDYLIEQALSPGLNTKKFRSHTAEKKYSLNRKQECGGKPVYHVHGEACAPYSICLGFEHYAGALQNLRTELLQHCKGLPDTHILNILRGECPLNGQYPELFFTHDLYIVGFGLDISEIDIWWLLTYRAFLMNSDYRKAGAYIQNKIIFCEVGQDEKKNLGKESMWDSLNVKYYYTPLQGLSYEECYGKVANWIGQDINREMHRRLPSF